jgi:KDO2-lipid IV(A) lauroyltransferase
MPSDRFWTTKFAAPRFAIAWLVYLWMRAVVLLPLRLQLAIGRAFGRVTYRLIPSRRRVVERNLEACFPELPAAERDRLARAHFAALGASLAEMATGWFGPPRKVTSRVTIEGAEHLRAALDAGKGVILFSAHFTTFEFYWAALRPLCTKLCGMYKWQRNPVMNDVMTRGRGRYFDHLFDKDSVRDMLRHLKSNYVVWYASDQSYSGKSSALLPFFGVPAMTNTAIGRIAKASGAAVLPYFCRRVDANHYVMSIYPRLEGFPSGDDERDMRRFIALLEDYVRLCPEQYWWIHQRFKGRPAPLPDLYAPARPAP